MTPSFGPSTRNPQDRLPYRVIDCVLNAQALLVTENISDFKAPARQLGFRAVRPQRFLEILEEAEP